MSNSDNPGEKDHPAQEEVALTTGGPGQTGGPVVLEGQVVSPAAGPIPQPRTTITQFVSHTRTQMTVQRSSPLPTAAEFKGYGETLSSAPERILCMAERQSSHRQDMERTALAGALFNERLGMVIGALVVVATLASAVAMVLAGYKDVAAVMAAIPAVGIGGVFVLRGRQQNLDARQQERALEQGNRKNLPPKQNDQARSRSRKKRK